MPDRATILREKTHKGLEIDRRVFYTLSEDKAFQAHRNTKALALLIQHLYDQGLMSEEQVDELLFDCIH